MVVAQRRLGLRVWTSFYPEQFLHRTWATKDYERTSVDVYI
jgi:hypothetical protein